MSTPTESLNELHERIRDGQVDQAEALRLIRAWKQARAVAPAVGADDTEVLRERVAELVVAKVCELLKVRPEDLDPDAELSEYGLDSIVLSQLAHMLNEALGLELAPTAFFGHPNLRAFSAHLVSLHGPSLAGRLGLRSRPTTAAAPVTEPTPAVAPEPVPGGRFAPHPVPAAPPVDRTDDPIAVVGLSGRFPQAEDIDAYWRNLSEGRDCIGEVPADRWDWHAYFGDPLQEPGRTNVKWGGFIDGVADFDPLFFGIAPKEARHMDPQQRLLMLYAWKALEDAGYAADALAGSDVGLFVGTGDTGYQTLAERSGGMAASLTPTGGVPSVGPNRMSYFLDVHGPSEPVETACSSSLVAIHRGVAAIERGECHMAIVGGVNTIVVPDGHISFGRAGMLSADGRCKTFSDRADGYVRGEGVGMLVLKRLSAAERDGDHIYGLVRSTAENHGGRANSLTSPNPTAQAALIRRAYSRVGIDPRTVGYIEAHGTGTELGDPIELDGLKAAFSELYAERGVSVGEAHCGVGSVKTNIGHLELAAGVAGVIKVLLQLRHRTLVESLHCETVNPYIDLTGSPFFLVRERQPWPALLDGEGRELPRRAGVSSFGFGGANAHVVLEEYHARDEPPVATPTPVAIVLSATDPEMLRARVAQLVAWIDAGRLTDDDLSRLAYTLQVGRVAMDERLACLTDSLAELRERLGAFLDGDTAPGVHCGRVDHRNAWSELVGDEDIAGAIDSWVAKGKLGRLLKLWVGGFDVDWRRLHAGRPMRRIPLPAYPFRSERYWITDAKAAVKAQLASAAESRHRRELNGSEFFLRDHRVRTVPTLPGVAYLEFVREAVVRSEPDAAPTGVRLRDVTWLRPLQVTAPCALDVTLEPVDDRARQAFRVSVDNNGEPVVHAQGTVQVDPSLGASPGAALDIDVLRASCPHERDGAECYALFERMGMGYGPAFQATETLHFGADLAVARLRLPRAAASSLTVNPGMLDAALQATLGLLLGERGDAPAGTALPFAVREVQVLSATTDEGWAIVRPAEDDRRDAAVRRLDIDLCDPRGNVCVRLLGFSTRVSRSEPAEADAAPPTRALLVEAGWRDSTPPEPRDDNMIRQVVMCELPGANASALAETLGGRCEAWQAEGDIGPRYTGYAERLVALLRDKAREAAEPPRLIQLVTPASAPWLGGLSGILRTAHLEYPELRTQWIEIDKGLPTDELAERLRRDGAELAEEAVRYRRGGRQVSRWREVPSPSPRLPWRDGGVYLLTGGAGGLGALFAREIAGRVHAPTLILCGRSPAGPAHEKLLGELGELGANASYRILDVADGAEVTRAVRDIGAEHGALHGIVHAAGVLRDGFIARKSADDLRDVFAAKVSGLCHLDEASAETRLDCFIGFSSLAAFGNVGQADYAAANAFMDGYAVHRESLVEQGARSGRTLMVNWPLWAEGGMRADASTVSLLEGLGMRPMRASVGIDALYRAWASPLPSVIALQGDHARMRERLLRVPSGNPPPAAPSPAAPSPANPPPAIPQPAARATPSAPSTEIPVADRVADSMARLLEIEPSSLRRDVPLHRYGFDSIFLTQFLGQAQKDFDESLTLDVLVECETLQDVIDTIAGTDPSRPTAAPVGGPDPAGEVASPSPAVEAPPPAVEAAPAAGFPELIRLNGVSSGRPVFWIHDGNGGVADYAPMAARCQRPFYGIQPKGWVDSGETLAGQDAIATHYTSIIRAVQPEGPYDIGGFSLGGLFAYEVVRQLQHQGADVNSLVMLDALDCSSTNRANDLMVGGRREPDAVAKVGVFRAVNLMLGGSRINSPDGAAPTLPRDEVDATLGYEAFLDSLIDAARERGIDKTDAQLRARVTQMSRYFVAVHNEYTVRPLPRRDEVRCYYVSNRSGVFFGAFEEYMVLFPNPDLPPVDGTTYWREWADQIDDFFVIDVDTAGHADVIAAPQSLEKVLRLCDKLYPPDAAAATVPHEPAGHCAGSLAQEGR